MCVVCMYFNIESIKSFSYTLFGILLFIASISFTWSLQNPIDYHCKRVIGKVDGYGNVFTKEDYITMHNRGICHDMDKVCNGLSLPVFINSSLQSMFCSILFLTISYITWILYVSQLLLQFLFHLLAKCLDSSGVKPINLCWVQSKAMQGQGQASPSAYSSIELPSDVPGIGYTLRHRMAVELFPSPLSFLSSRTWISLLLLHLYDAH